VQRAGDAVSLLLADAAASEPNVPCRRALPERVAIELAGTSLGTSRLLRIEVRRSLD
jgi:ethanolamine ammonia-lyase small subunit